MAYEEGEGGLPPLPPLPGLPPVDNFQATRGSRSYTLGRGDLLPPLPRAPISNDLMYHSSSNTFSSMRKQEEWGKFLSRELGAWTWDQRALTALAIAHCLANLPVLLVQSSLSRWGVSEEVEEVINSSSSSCLRGIYAAGLLFSVVQVTVVNLHRNAVLLDFAFATYTYYFSLPFWVYFSLMPSHRAAMNIAGHALLLAPIAVMVLSCPVFFWLRNRLKAQFGWELYKVIGARMDRKGMYMEFLLVLALLTMDGFLLGAMELFFHLTLKPYDIAGSAIVAGLVLLAIFLAILVAIWGVTNEHRGVVLASIVGLWAGLGAAGLMCIVDIFFVPIHGHPPAQDNPGDADSRDWQADVHDYFLFYTAANCLVTLSLTIYFMLRVKSHFGKGLIAYKQKLGRVATEGEAEGKLRMVLEDDTGRSDEEASNNSRLDLDISGLRHLGLQESLSTMNSEGPSVVLESQGGYGGTQQDVSDTASGVPGPC